jgi:hypothetical protein
VISDTLIPANRVTPVLMVEGMEEFEEEMFDDKHKRRSTMPALMLPEFSSNDISTTTLTSRISFSDDQR